MPEDLADLEPEEQQKRIKPMPLDASKSRRRVAMCFC